LPFWSFFAFHKASQTARRPEHELTLPAPPAGFHAAEIWRYTAARCDKSVTPSLTLKNDDD
jgi:hypothetical protein